MKVLYDYQIFSTQKYGGVSRYFYELIKGLLNEHSEECEVDLFLGLFVNQYGFQKFQDKCNFFFGKQLPLINKTGKIRAALNKSIFQLVSSRLSSQVYHPTYFWMPKKNFAGKKVITVYDMIHELYPKYFSKSDQTSQFKRRSVNWADTVITISENTKKDLMRLFDVPDKKIKVIHLASSLQASGNFEKTTEDRGSRPFILFVGNREGYKNFEFLIKAYSNSKVAKNDCDLVSFGDRPFNSREMDLFKKYGVSHNVRHILGDDSTLSGLYQRAEMFVYPSLYEGFGLPPLEAMTFGCPVLAAHCSSIPEVVGDGGIYFDPEDVDSLTENIDRLMVDSDLNKKIRVMGLKRSTVFSWKNTVQQTFDLYKN